MREDLTDWNLKDVCHNVDDLEKSIKVIVKSYY